MNKLLVIIMMCLLMVSVASATTITGTAVGTDVLSAKVSSFINITNSVILDKGDIGIQITNDGGGVADVDTSSIRLKPGNPEAKPDILWDGYYDNGTDVVYQEAVGWILCHYNSSLNSNAHQHCSWEMWDEDTGLNSRFMMNYGASDVSGMWAQFSQLNYVLFGNGVDLRFHHDDNSLGWNDASNAMIYGSEGDVRFKNPDGETFNTYFYTGTSPSDRSNDSSIIIYGDGNDADYLNLSNDGTDSYVTSNQGNLNLVTGGGGTINIESDNDLVFNGASSDIKHSDGLDIYPDGQTSYAFAFSNVGGVPSMSTKGASTFRIDDGVLLNGDLEFDTGHKVSNLQLENMTNFAVGCDESLQGSITYKSSDHTFYGCNSTNWVALN